MAFRVAEFVEQRTTTTGTNDLELTAVTGRNTFVSGIGDGNTTDYAVFNSSQWEVGTGTVVAGSPDVLQRTTVRASSNGGNKVSFSSGTKTVVCSQAAHRVGGNDPHDLVQLDDNCDVSISGGVRIASTLSVKQDMSVSGSLTLARTLHVGKDASVSGSLAVGGALSASGNVTVGGGLTVNGTSSFGAAIDLSGNEVKDSPITINHQDTSTYELVLSDAGRWIEISSSGTAVVSVPSNASVGYSTGTLISFEQTGSGTLSITGNSGVTINTNKTKNLNGQWAVATLKKSDTDRWVLFGDLVSS